MRSFLFSILFFLSASSFAQLPCDWSTNVTDSLGTYKNTRDYLVYERNFAGNMNYVYFSLALTDELPTLNIQFINKSKDFMPARCLDKNSRVYLQLNNGKIITLVGMNVDDCGTSVRTEDQYINRIMKGYFLFGKDSFEELLKSPVALMRIKFSGETVDYVLKQQLISEVDGKTYLPEKFFINTLPCIKN
jgi:hypothetical protein